MSKPVVHFLNGSLMETGYRGQVSVLCLDHPNLGCARIITSSVMQVRDDGSFETLNSIYVPIPEGDMEDYIKDVT